MQHHAPRKVLRHCLLTACFLLWPKSILHADDFSAWPKSSDVALNTTASGADVAGMVVNFPVLVRLNSVNFPFSQADGRGRDIRFAKPDGTPLAHEIERWDSTRATAEIWVKADTVRGNTAGQILKMYWGNASATDASNAAGVFRSADNFTAAWHLGGPGVVPRPNAVTGGNAAAPNNYDGDESVNGLIGLSDSLDGGPDGDFLDVGDGYAEFTPGFTFSVWVYPTSVKRWSHILDLGNGSGKDNIIVNRVDNTATLGFYNWTDAGYNSSPAAGQWVLNQWQHIAVTVNGRNVRIYKNGSQVLGDTLPEGITGAYRTTNFLGKSNWTADEYFQGRMDEPELSKTARSPDWIKLAYQNQRAMQTLVTAVRSVTCPVRFVPPRDTALAEGSLLSLDAAIECASYINWSIVSGPGPGILDPESRSLMLRLPRVAGNTSIVYRLTAGFPDSTRIRDVRVTIREAIPDPVFTLPVLLPAWSGREAVPYRPVISNLAAILASRDSILHWNWTFTGLEVDTGWLADGVILERASTEGILQVRLCLDNGGTPACRNADIDVMGTATGMDAARARAIHVTDLPVRDALGRSPRNPGFPAPHGFPVFRRK
ncbi:MAG: DUF2341 domain-containing protein [Fibrobacteria bacterium]